ncbi:hypothetical protein OIY81_2171 [Cryptosporidium canis]|nr:hypothetical protein OIY81_2171 [Cryptosporidium canis]
MNFLSNITLASLIALFFIYFNQAPQVESALSLNSFQEFSFIRVRLGCGKLRKKLCCCCSGSTEEDEEEVVGQNHPGTPIPINSAGNQNNALDLEESDISSLGYPQDRERSESTSSYSSSSSSGSSYTTSSSGSPYSSASSGTLDNQSEEETPTDEAA